MKSIFKIISASIRKKKGISVAIVLTALIAGLLLSYSATLFYNVADFYADKIDELGTAHNIYALGEADRDCVPKLVRWLKNDKRIEKAASFDSLYCTGEMQVPDGNVIAQVFYFAPMNQDTEIRLCVPLTDTISDSGIYLPESMKSYGFTEGSDFKYMMDNKTYTYTVYSETRIAYDSETLKLTPVFTANTIEVEYKYAVVNPSSGLAEITWLDPYGKVIATSTALKNGLASAPEIKIPAGDGYRAITNVAGWLDAEGNASDLVIGNDCFNKFVKSLNIL